MELFVQSFPTPGAKYQVSSGGANNTATSWTRGGRELMFMAIDGFTVMAAEVTTGASFKAGEPRELFKVRPTSSASISPPTGSASWSWRRGPAAGASITIEVNWTAQMGNSPGRLAPQIYFLPLKLSASIGTVSGAFLED